MSFLVVFAVTHGMFLLLVSSENVETRIHKLITATGPSKLGFGTSLQADQSAKLLYAGAPKLQGGGFYSCRFAFKTMKNESLECSSKVTFGTDNSTVGSTMAKMNAAGKDYLLVCGNQYQFSCPDLEIEQRMIGECHSYKISDGSKSSLLTPCPFKCPQGLVADLVFLMDASGSVKTPDFKLGLDWINTVLEQFSYDIDANNLHVGYVIFNSSPYKVVSPRARAFYGLKDEILAIINKRGGTATDKAIERATEILKEPTSREVTKIMITITDGVSNNAQSTLQAAVRARNARIVMIAVGVGSNVNVNELRGIATGNVGDSTRVMTVVDYSNLNGIIDKLSEVIKESASGSLEGASSNATTELTNCQFGTSITASTTGFYVGAVGSYDRIGTVAEYKNIDSFPSSISSGHLSESEIATMLETTTNEIKDIYLGYSVTSGKFSNDGKDWIVMSAPRYFSRGLVLIYQDKSSPHVALRPLKNSGFWQLGGYYGHSVLAMDINKDGYDDLIVSAPLYSKLDKHDVGIVFVYMNDKSGSAVANWMNPGFLSLTLEGSGSSGARFGMMVVDGGDIDKNGYNDIIVGAPYEKDSIRESGSGAIYIYFASSRGLNSATYQRILGSSFSTLTQTLSGFGHAIYGGVDIDDNGYPDVIVSAPSSDNAVLLRSRKIIAATLDVSVTPSTINILKCAKNLQTSCSVVRVCYSAQFEDKTLTGKLFGMSLNITLDSLIGENIYKRFIFTNSKSSKITVSDAQAGSSLTCREYKMQLNMDTFGKVNSGGLDTVPQVELGVDLSESHKKQIMSGILNSMSQNTKTVDWIFEKGCSGSGKRCQHDLVITAVYSEDTSATPLILEGSSKVFSINCLIENKGPDYAYFLKVNISSGNFTVLRVIGGCAVISDDEGDSDNGVTVIKYQSQEASPIFKDLMRSGETCKFTVEFDFAKLQKSANEPHFKIDGLIYSNAGDDDIAFDQDKSNNEFSYKKNLQYKSMTSLIALSIPQNVLFQPINNTDVIAIKTLEDDIFGGSQANLAHKYSIYNNGPLGLANAKVKILWPEKTENGYNIFYLVDVTCQPEGSCNCNKQGKTNKLQIAPNTASIGPSFKEVVVQYPDQGKALNSSTNIDCSNSVCDEIYCDISYIEVFSEVAIIAHFIPWVPTFNRNFKSVVIYSSFEILIANFNLNTGATKEIVGTTMTSHDFSEPVTVAPSNSLNIGAIIGGIIGGILLLVIAVLIMWKAGFFKSKYGNMTREGRRTVRERGEGPTADEGVYEPVNDPQMNKSTENLAD